jgi:polysaccharide biosynthesis protein VpsQ
MPAAVQPPTSRGSLPISNPAAPLTASTLPAWVILFRWMTLAMVVFLGVVYVWADRGAMPAPIAALYAFPDGDKVGHFCLYGLLAFLTVLAFPHPRIHFGPWSIFPGPLVVLALALLEELSQLFFRTRTASLSDLAPGWIGALLFTWIASRALRLLLARPAPAVGRRGP